MSFILILNRKSLWSPEDILDIADVPYQTRTAAMSQQ